ncbi:MAG: ankyrin repeat domain-containing protein, partial [bacterium]
VVMILMKEVDQRNRMLLARNSALTFENLVTLANDPYRVVSAEARKYLRIHFPEQAKRVLPSLPDLSQLSPASNKSDELLMAVKKRDLSAIDVCGKYFSSNDVLQPSHQQLFGEVLRTGDPTVMMAVLQHFNSLQPSLLIKDDAMNRQWLDFFHKNGMFVKDPFNILSSCIENNKLDALDYLLGKGLDVNARDKEGRTLLIHALKLRSIKIVEALLSRGADPAIADNMGLRAVDYAARSYLISIVKKLDTNDKYSDMVKAFSLAFPAEKGSPLLGTWSNHQTGFSYSALFLSDDGTGVLNTGIMDILVAWRSAGGSKIELLLFSNNGPDPKQKITFQYHIAEKILAIIDEKEKEGESKYYKVL